MVGDSIAKIEATEPAIGKVEMHLLAQPSFRPDAEQIADQQHPQHELGINRRPPRRTIAARQRLAHEAKVEQPVDSTQKVVAGHVILEPEAVKQRPLRHLLTHHAPHSRPPGPSESLSLNVRKR
ncbi:hypothetical protein SPAN111604_14595 [Sphingomonas antarctica]